MNYTHPWSLEAGGAFLTYALIDRHLLGARCSDGSWDFNSDPGSGSQVTCWGWGLESSLKKVLCFRCAQCLLGDPQQRGRL